jgi:hypothetical protein
MRRSHTILLEAIDDAAHKAELDSESARTPGAEYAARVGAATLRHLHAELEAKVERRSRFRGGVLSRWGMNGRRSMALGLQGTSRGPGSATN